MSQLLDVYPVQVYISEALEADNLHIGGVDNKVDVKQFYLTPYGSYMDRIMFVMSLQLVVKRSPNPGTTNVTRPFREFPSWIP